jgi:hypothetical protein
MFIFVFAVVVAGFFSANTFAEFYVISVNNKCGPCKGTRSAGGRWCDNGDGTVTDMTTCLVWLKYADWGGKEPWRSGETDCSSPDYTCYKDAFTRVGFLANGEVIKSGETVYLTDGSTSGDWRLPTKTELSGIINDGGETVCSSNMQVFKGVQSYGYWSSTTRASNTNHARGVAMDDGFVYFDEKVFSYNVWPVRSDN